MATPNLVIETSFIGTGSDGYFAESVSKFSCGQLASHKEIIMMGPHQTHHTDKWMIKQHRMLETTEEKNFVHNGGRRIGQNTVIVRTQLGGEPAVTIELPE